MKNTSVIFFYFFFSIGFCQLAMSNNSFSQLGEKGDSTIANIQASSFELNCATSLINLDASNSSTQDTASFLWSDGSTSTTISVSSPGTYELTVTDNGNGCEDVTSVSITQDINAPIAAIISSNNELTCNTTTITLDASTSSAQGAISYLWSDGSAMSTLNVTVSGSYEVTITDSQNGCTDVASITITQDIIAPNAVIDAFTTELNCNIRTITLGASTSTVQGTISFLWSNGSAMAMLNVTTPGAYNVTITDSDNGCTDVASITITQDLTDSNLLICGKGIPITSGDMSPSLSNDTDFGVISIGSDSTKCFTVKNVGATSLSISSIISDNSEFEIIDLPSSIAAGDSQLLKINVNPIQITDVTSSTITIESNDCNNSFSFGVQVEVRDSLSSIHKIENELASLKVYPNPATNHIVLHYKLQKSQASKIELFNTNGQLVKSKDLGIKSSGKHFESLNLIGFESGLYYLKFYNNNLITFRKFFKN